MAFSIGLGRRHLATQPSSPPRAALGASRAEEILENLRGSMVSAPFDFLRYADPRKGQRRTMRLVRHGVGDWTLDDLAPGSWREV